MAKTKQKASSGIGSASIKVRFQLDANARESYSKLQGERFREGVKSDIQILKRHKLATG